MSAPQPVTMLDQLREFEKRIGFLERRPASSGEIPLVTSAAQLAALVAAFRPSPTRPLVVQRADQGPVYIAVTTDGVQWSRTWPDDVEFNYLTSMGSGWVNYKSLFHDIGYTKTSAGIVNVTGLIGSGTTDVNLFTLPVGYRPAAPMIFLVFSNGAPCFVVIGPDGVVSLWGASSAWASIDLMFPSSDVAPNAAWTAITAFSSGWASRHLADALYPPLAYWQDSLGRVWFRGMPYRPDGVLPTSDQPMFSVPAALTAGYHMHFPGVAGGTGFASLENVGNVFRCKPGTQSTLWISMSHATYVPSAVMPIASFEQLRTNLDSWSTLTGWPNASMAVFSDGVVMMEGLLTGGTVAPGARSGWIPDGLSPDVRLFSNNGHTGTIIYPVNAANAIGRTDVGRTANPGTTTIGHQTGSNAWRSLHGINYLIGS